MSPDLLVALLLLLQRQRRWWQLRPRLLLGLCMHTIKAAASASSSSRMAMANYRARRIRHLGLAAVAIPF
jgi:hypothetical protein